MKKLKIIKEIIKRFDIEKVDNNFYIIQVGYYTTSGEKKDIIKNIIECIKLNLKIKNI